jgi:hypothetical protein
MKKLFALFMVALSINAFAQQKSYVTKTIANWSFEKFPAHYYVVPVKFHHVVYGFKAFVLPAVFASGA